MANKNEITPERWEKFFDALRDIPYISHACEISLIGRNTVYQRRKIDEEFATKMEEAISEGIEKAEREAHRRAFKGVERPVYQGGVLVGTTTEYSDSLTTFLLKAHRPEKYRERQDVKVSGGITLQVVTGVPEPGEDLV